MPANNVKFTVILKNSFKAEKVYLCGNNEILGKWNPAAVLMHKESDSVWTRTLSLNQGSEIEFKVTGGTWWAQAIDSTSQIYNNFSLRVEHDTTVYIDVFDWQNKILNGVPVLTKRRFLPNRPYLVIDELWKFHPGDNPAWALPDYNDSSWIETDSYMNWRKPGNPKWDNIGWFRFHFIADSEIWNHSLALFIGQLGASEIYYNGRLLYSFGKVGMSKQSTLPEQNRIWKEFRIDPLYEQVLAVRYANYNSYDQLDNSFTPGFVIYLKDMNTILSGIKEDWRGISINQMVFTLIPVILFFLHILLYSFYPKQRENLYYSICLLGFAGITYFGYEKLILTDPSTIMFYYKLNGLSVPVAIFFGLLTAYSINYQTLPKRRWLFFGLFLVNMMAAIFINMSDAGKLNYVFFGITMIDIIYLSFRHGFKENEPKMRWVIAAGFLLLTLAVIYQILIDYSYLAPPFAGGQVFVYGMIALIISMSIYLSYNFAYINKDLELQLSKVKLLSEKTIEQERTASRRELERRVIEVENKRKSRELEDARELQLSLLPKEIPQYENFDISCFMKTATEVGGDYYDVLPEFNGSLTLVIGDATGHGVKAGTMVAVIKGLFQELTGSTPLNHALERIHQTIRSMRFHNLYMGLTLVRLEKHQIIISSAGMPPTIIYNKKNNSVSELIIRHLPLGAPANNIFEEHVLEISEGDVVLLLSDGLPELFNEKKDLFGYDKIKGVLFSNSSKSAGQIIESILTAAAGWSAGSPQNDDITMIALKVNNDLS